MSPHDHYRNAAEKDIQMFEDHFIAMLCGTDDTFPMRLWCSLLPHAVVQLNMLRSSAINPSISAFEQLHGPHNYDSHPFAILGNAVEVHVTPDSRRTWDEHTIPGFYLDPSWEHYRCHDEWITETRATRTGQILLFFKQQHITCPTITTADALIHTGQELCAELTAKDPGSLQTNRAVETLMQIFREKASRSEVDADHQRVRRAMAHALRKRTEEELAAKPQRVPAGDDDCSVGTADTEPLTDEEESVVGENQIAYDDGLRMNGLQMTYSATKEASSPKVISQDDSPSQYTMSKMQALLSAIDMPDSCPSASQAALRTFPLQFLADFAAAVIDDDTGELLEYRHLIKNPKCRKDWGHSFGNELGRLSQSMPGRSDGTNTMSFIDKAEIPNDCWSDVAQSRIVCNVRPKKLEINRTHLTYGGHYLNVHMDCSTPTASMITIKLLFNSVISTHGARFMTIDIKDFYLNTPLERLEYLRMKLSYFPDDVIEHYKHKGKVDRKGFVYVKIVRGMYGLPHASSATMLPPTRMLS